MSDNEENLVERDYEGEMRIKMSEEEEDNEENLVEHDYEGEKRIKMSEEEEEDNEENLVERDYEGEMDEAFHKLEKKLADMFAEQNEKFEEMNLKLKKQQDMLDEFFTYFE